MKHLPPTHSQDDSQVNYQGSHRNTPQDGFQDEIDLAELFANLWKKRYIALLITLLGGLIGGGVFIKHWFSHPLTTSTVVEVRFNFPSIQNGTYPNGQSFSLNDLIAPAVLNQVYDQQQLQAFNLSRTDFIKAVQIAPFATDREFIEAKFKDGLTNSKLPAAEIAELNDNYAKALDLASRRFAKISLSVNAGLAIPANTLMTVIAAIPATWATESIASYGVLDIAVAKPGQLDRNLIDDYEYLIAAQYLNDHLSYIRRSANALQQDDIGRLQIDNETQQTIEDVIESLNNLKEFHVDILLRAFSVAPIARDIVEARFYLDSQIISSQATLDQLNRQAALVEQAYRQYLARELTQQDTPPTAGANNYGYTAQYGDDFLTKLMSIGDQLSDAKFKQTLLNRSLDLKLQAEQTITRINRLQRNRDTLTSDALTISTDNKAAVASNTQQDDADVQRVKREIAYVSTHLEKIGAVINRIADLRSQRVLGQSGALYDLNSEPRLSSNFTSQIKSLIKYAGLGGVAGFFIGLMLALLLALTRKTK